MPIVTQVTRVVRPTPGWYWYRDRPEVPPYPVFITADSDGELFVNTTADPEAEGETPFDEMKGELGDELPNPKKFTHLSSKGVTTTESSGGPRIRRHFTPAKDQKIDGEKLDKFIYWMRGRHNIQLARMAGKPKPWTKDKVLQDNFFCNVFRELDKNTVWFREHIRDPLKKSTDVILATVIFRWFNHIPTAISLLTGSDSEIRWELDSPPPGPTLPKLLKSSLFTNWDSTAALKLLKNHKQVFTSAHVVASGLGAMKLESILTCIDQFAKRLEDGIEEFDDLQEMHQWLRESPAIGGFLAYEIVSDLRHTDILKNCDPNKWANAGPGAMRGLDRLYNRPLYFQRKSYDWSSEMKELHALCVSEIQKKGKLVSLLSPISPYLGAKPFVPLFELREVEHSLCEFDKYMRVVYPSEEAYEPGSNPKQSKRKYAGAS